MAKLQTTRRNFVRMAPLAAGAAVSLQGAPLMALGAIGAGRTPVPFQVFKKAEMDGWVSGFMAAAGSKDIVGGPGLSITMNVSAEEKKSGKEFEWHEHRDHLFQVLEGETVYLLGGTPKGAHTEKPGEWFAPESDGHARVELKKGDYLTVPRGTPHKRVTEGKVSLLLLSANSPD